MIKRHRRFILSLLVGVALLFGVSRFINLATTLERFEDYPWPDLWLVMLFSLGYYLLKALRWHYFLGVIDIRLPLHKSVLVYLAGQWFAFTPAGEFVRAYLLTAYGYSFGRGSAAVAVQVIFDFLSLALLGSISVFRYHELAGVVLPFTGFFILAVLAFAYGPLIVHRGHAAEELAMNTLHARWARFYDRCRRLLAPRCLAMGTALGLIAVVDGSLILFQVSQGYQIQVDVAQSAYVFSLSQLLGGLSMIPHGLGAIEASSIVLFQYAGVDTANAASAVILFRLATVGFSLLLGGLSLLALRTPLGRCEPGQTGRAIMNSS
ncbi:MAG: flippase-like domain-containing protein [Chloroflexi bacterium]|nr:flippase-like domain-containing protein [Chloroflexota bacterium]